MKAHAEPITGSVSFSGAVTVDNNNLTLATKFTSFSGVTVGAAPTGDYIGLTPTVAVTMTPFQFAPLTGPVPALWQCTQGGATYGFDLNTLQINSRTTRTLFMSGTGVAHITGYDDTPGTWSFSMQGFTTFSFNATNTVPGWLGDYVWEDLDQDGIQDAGEPGIPGVTLTLTKPGGATETTTTDAEGYYYFVNLGSGDYIITVATPAGYIPAPSGVGADRAADSNGSGTTVTLASGYMEDDTLDFGFIRAAGAIGDFVWQDLDQDGIQDAGEPGIDGVTVWLKDPAAPGIILATAITANNGAYLFPGLVAGTYLVEVDTSSPALAGFVPTFSNAPGSVPANDSDATPLTVILPAGDSEDLTADFGFIPTPPGTIGDYVWFDRNNDGLQGAPGDPDFEPGIAGVVVQLVSLDLPDEPVIDIRITDPDGYYLFEGLPPGHYRVLVDNSQPVLADAGYLPTVSSPPVPAGGTIANDSNTNPSDVTLVLQPAVPGGVSQTSSDTTIDFGYYRLSSLAGYVYVDANNDGLIQATEAAIAGVTVTLTGTDDMNNPVHLTTTTNDHGLYIFTALRPGIYTLTETQPAAFLDGKDTIGTPGGITDNDVFSSVVLDFGVDGENNNFGERLLPPGFTLVKTADKQSVAPYEPVTYFYTVTNTGGTTLTNIVVTDDNGTQLYPADDFTVGTISSLAPGASATLTAVVVPVVSTVGVVNGATINAGAVIVVTTLESGDIKVTYLQDFGINDNTYGTGQIGWPNGHKFGDLAGSDKLEFRFYDKAGNVAIDFYLDCITAASSVTVPGTGQVISYPSGYGTLGPFGGDGSMVAGNASNIISFATSISDNLNKAANLPNKAALIVNSPTSLVAGNVVIDPVKAPGGWEHINSYTAVVKAAAFAAGGGFGSVVVPDQHNSPNKPGGPNGMVTTPVSSIVTNTATATTGTLTDTATATVNIVVPPVPPPATLAITARKIDAKAKQLQITIANTGTADVILSEVTLQWPSANGKLMKVLLDGDVVYDIPDIAGTSATITAAQLVKDLPKRTIQKGTSDVFKVTFERTPDGTLSNYSGLLTFTNGATLMIP